MLVELRLVLNPSRIAAQDLPPGVRQADLGDYVRIVNNFLFLVDVKVDDTKTNLSP